MDVVFQETFNTVNDENMFTMNAKRRKTPSGVREGLILATFGQRLRRSTGASPVYLERYVCKGEQQEQELLVGIVHVV
jgi:hypothetical protein